jgi:hypothetical protein
VYRNLSGTDTVDNALSQPNRLFDGPFEGIEQLLKPPLVGSHGLGRTCKFDEHVFHPSFRIHHVNTSGGQTMAVLRSFVASRELANVDRFAWFQDVLSRIGAHSIQQLDELLPHRWAAARL